MASDGQIRPVQPGVSQSYLLDEARRHDPDRFLCALLAPAERRDALLTLLLFNHALARIPEIVSQPMAGMIRLQWWRDALGELESGQPARRHPVVEALSVVLAGGLVEPAALHALIDAREPALERIPPEAGALETYAATTSGALQSLAYAALGGRAAAEAAGPPRSARPSVWPGSPTPCTRRPYAARSRERGTPWRRCLPPCGRAPPPSCAWAGRKPGGRRGSTWPRSCRPRWRMAI